MTGDQTPYMVFSNAPQTVVISNFVTYTNWSSLILSNSYTFNRAWFPQHGQHHSQ
jgi:hypothetical protein